MRWAGEGEREERERGDKKLHHIFVNGLATELRQKSGGGGGRVFLALSVSGGVFPFSNFHFSLFFIYIADFFKTPTTNNKQNKMKKGMTVLRPPGHHAEESEATGFCAFNNVA